ncbi:hypothetical protein EMPG_09720 [Blastomyces silverae]|uniref:Uncharacterized protein n=1 Tax=Blastomyces silverae TaxID=2060906 RepID=A0A0H1BJB2_9EURO|nr:hypothetical protein EMPG_09720 [Blastomyces silverae]
MNGLCESSFSYEERFDDKQLANPPSKIQPCQPPKSAQACPASLCRDPVSSKVPVLCVRIPLHFAENQNAIPSLSPYQKYYMRQLKRGTKIVFRKAPKSEAATGSSPNIRLEYLNFKSKQKNPDYLVLFSQPYCRSCDTSSNTAGTRPAPLESYGMFFSDIKRRYNSSSVVQATLLLGMIALSISQHALLTSSRDGTFFQPAHLAEMPLGASGWLGINSTAWTLTEIVMLACQSVLKNC